MSKSKLNGVDPQDIRRPTTRAEPRALFVCSPGTRATLEWSDAGVEGDDAVPDSAVDVRASGTRRRGRRDAADRRRARTTRREIHSHAEAGPNYDYERIQYNTVVSAGMTMS
jgi:leucyl-tRNA synthetase